MCTVYNNNLHLVNIAQDTKRKIRVKLSIFFYESVLTYVLGAQKNRLTETVLLSTQNICFS